MSRIRIRSTCSHHEPSDPRKPASLMHQNTLLTRAGFRLGRRSRCQPMPQRKRVSSRLHVLSLESSHRRRSTGSNSLNQRVHEPSRYPVTSTPPLQAGGSGRGWPGGEHRKVARICQGPAVGSIPRPPCHPPRAPCAPAARRTSYRRSPIRPRDGLHCPLLEYRKPCHHFLTCGGSSSLSQPPVCCPAVR